MICAIAWFALLSFVSGGLAHLTAGRLYKAEPGRADYFARAARRLLVIAAVSGVVAGVLWVIARAGQGPAAMACPSPCRWGSAVGVRTGKP